MQTPERIQSIIDLCNVTWSSAFHAQAKLRWWQFVQYRKREAEMDAIMVIWRAAAKHRLVLHLSENKDGLDAERWRKLRESIYRFGRFPSKFQEFVAVTGGSTPQGLDEAIDAERDLRGI